MTNPPAVKINQRDLHPQTNSIQALAISVSYGDGIDAEATILLRPGALMNDEKSIRDEVERLGKALVLASRSPNGLTG